LCNVYDQLILKIVGFNKPVIYADCDEVIPLFLNMSLACDYRIVATHTIFQKPYFELETLPKGHSIGPEPTLYQPWKEMDYGNWLIQCYELADSDDPPKVISGGKAPLANEDYSKVNFAYKGIAMRLDPGEGGVAR